MIKRSTGFFKIAFFVFCTFIALFLILFSLTDIRNYVTTEMCIFAFCISITIIPLILELLVYLIGLLTKCIIIESKNETLKYTSMKNSAVPYAVINDNGTEKMMFFCEKGKIALLSAQNTKIFWDSEKDEIQMKTKLGKCFSIFKSIYGVKYEHVECEVYTTLSQKEPKDSNCSESSVSQLPIQQDISPVPSNIPSESPIVSTTPPIAPQVPLHNETVANNVDDTPFLESTEEFDYSLKDTDCLIEETIKL